MLPRVLIIGYATHGKDTVGELLEKYGFKCMASSSYATMRIMMPYFESIGKPYPSAKVCFADRVNHRALWLQQIEAYNAPTWDRLSREMSAEGYDVYLGMRSKKEFEASKYLYDFVVWVDASDRLPPEDISSCTLVKNDADIILDNNGTLEDLKHRVDTLVEMFNSRMHEW